MLTLVTGASGFLGRHVVQSLLARGGSVRALVRKPAAGFPFNDSRVEQAACDLRVGAGLPDLLRGCDRVVHLAAAVLGDEETQFANTVVATERLLEAMGSAGPQRLLHCSSFSVYDWRAPRTKLDENAQLETRLYERDGYAIAKAWQERLVRRYAEKNGWGLTVVRPGFIWGRGADDCAGAGQSFGGAFLVVGWNRALPITYVENCADAICHALDDPRSVGGTFNVIDDERVTAWRYQQQRAKRHRDRTPRLLVPYHGGLAAAMTATLLSRWWFRGKGKLPGVLMPIRFRARFRPLRFPNHALRNGIDWSPPYGFAEACARAATGTSGDSPLAVDAPGLRGAEPVINRLVEPTHA